MVTTMLLCDDRLLLPAELLKPRAAKANSPLDFIVDLSLQPPNLNDCVQNLDSRGDSIDKKIAKLTVPRIGIFNFGDSESRK